MGFFQHKYGDFITKYNDDNGKDNDAMIMFVIIKVICL